MAGRDIFRGQAQPTTIPRPRGLRSQPPRRVSHHELTTDLRNPEEIPPLRLVRFHRPTRCLSQFITRVHREHNPGTKIKQQYQRC